MPAFVYWLAGTLAAGGRPVRADRRRHRRVHDAPEPAVLPARASCSTSRSRSRARSRCSTGSSSTSTSSRRSSTRPTRSRSSPTTVRGAVAFERRGVPLPARAGARPRPARRAGAAEPIEPPRSRRPGSPPRRVRPRRRAPDGTGARAGRLPPTRSPRPSCRCAASSPFGLEDVSFEARPGRARRARRAVGRRQDDDHVPDPAPVRRRRRAGSRSTASTSGRSSSRRWGGSIGFVTQETYLFHASIRENLLFAKPDATEAELDDGDPRGRDPRPDRGAARRPRHDRRRARLQAVGRREAAGRDRPGAAQGPADPDPRRGDVVARHGLASG